MNIIDERDERTKKRKIAKAKFDEIITLSAFEGKGTVNLAAKTAGESVRLLDEGMIVYADGSPDFYIQKGTIAKYLDGTNTYLRDADGAVMNLTDDYVGSINIGHLDFATFPVGIVGTWTKKDLSMTESEDGRASLDVRPNINEEHPLIKALRVQNIPVGVSVEMYLHFDSFLHLKGADASDSEKASEEYEVGIVDEIFISDFAIVGECGNVGSSETILKGGESVEDTKNLTIEETVEEITEEIVEETVNEEEIVEEAVEETEEVEIEEGIVEEAECDEDEAEEDDELEQVMEAVNDYRAEIERLSAENKALKKTNKRLNAKLKAELDKKKSFITRFPRLTVDMGLQESEEKEEETKPVARYASDDGIGE